MGHIEYTFKTDAEAWAFADERGIDTVIERHFASCKVRYIVRITRKEQRV